MAAVNEYYQRRAEAHVESLSSVSAPALVLHGTHDPFFPVEHGRELADSLPNARFVEYAGGHSLGNHRSVFDLIVAAMVEHMTLHGTSRAS